ncbi:MAG: hypothetical protein P9L98_01620 [Candidatus Kaelpia imicola]|nr:hypothetical protein [Candidatus Kaelpia imicola]
MAESFAYFKDSIFAVKYDLPPLERTLEAELKKKGINLSRATVKFPRKNSLVFDLGFNYYREHGNHPNQNTDDDFLYIKYINKLASLDHLCPKDPNNPKMREENVIGLRSIIESFDSYSEEEIHIKRKGWSISYEEILCRNLCRDPNIIVRAETKAIGEHIWNFLQPIVKTVGSGEQQRSVEYHLNRKTKGKLPYKSDMWKDYSSFKKVVNDVMQLTFSKNTEILAKNTSF